MMMRLIVILLFSLLTAQVYATTVPADGLWGTTDNPAIGSGLMLTTQGGITVVSVFTYDADGNNVWYLAAGQVDAAGVLETELLQASNGSDIFAENPQSAVYIESPRTIRLAFGGSQIGTISIDGSTPKSMQVSHFGFYTAATEQLLLADETQYQFPMIDGNWVIGDAGSGESYILRLRNFGTGASPPSPNFSLNFLSNHPSTDNWSILCPQRVQTIQPFCRVFRRGNTNDEFPELRIDLLDLGNQRMTIYQDTNESPEKYQAFRLNKDRRLLPNDGYWRLSDDPGIGSGLVMRTQGDFTVALVYTYNDEGRATWGIASGKFDENGLLVAELNWANGGWAIENESPETASFSEQVQSLEIQLQGTELATFSIGGSATKTIQNFNFGVELFQTTIFEPSAEPFYFPNQVGSWVLVDENRTVTSVWEIAAENPNCCQSPPDPNYYDSAGYTNRTWINDADINPNFSVHFNCVKNRLDPVNYWDFSFCYGSNYRDVSNELMKIYFEDIGFNEFRYYIGPWGIMLPFEDAFLSIDRSSDHYQLFRLSTE